MRKHRFISLLPLLLLASSKLASADLALNNELACVHAAQSIEPYVITRNEQGKIVLYAFTTTAIYSIPTEAAVESGYLTHWHYFDFALPNNGRLYVALETYKNSINLYKTERAPLITDDGRNFESSYVELNNVQRLDPASRKILDDVILNRINTPTRLLHAYPEKLYANPDSRERHLGVMIDIEAKFVEACKNVPSKQAQDALRKLREEIARQRAKIEAFKASQSDPAPAVEHPSIESGQRPS